MHRNGMILVFNDDESSGGHLRQPITGRSGQPMAGSYTAVSTSEASLLARG